MKQRIKTWTGAIVFLLLIIIIFQNVESVTTHLLFVTIKMPRAVLLLVTVAVGFILGQIFSLNFSRRR